MTTLKSRSCDRALQITRLTTKGKNPLCPRCERTHSLRGRHTNTGTIICSDDTLQCVSNDGVLNMWSMRSKAAGQRAALMINSKHKFKANTMLGKSQPAGVNRSVSLMFELWPLTMTFTCTFLKSMIEHLWSVCEKKSRQPYRLKCLLIQFFHHVISDVGWDDRCAQTHKHNHKHFKYMVGQNIFFLPNGPNLKDKVSSHCAVVFFY